MHLLPTPVADNSRGLPSEGTDYQSLPNALVALLPTPQARDEKGYGPADLKRNDPNLSALPLMLPTPRATDGTKGGPNQRGSSGDLMLPSAVQLIPTPSVADSTGGHERRGGKRGDELLLKGLARAQAEGKLLPTPIATHWAKTSDGAREKYGSSDSMQDIVEADRWGEYGPAIRRWEAVTRPAPEPTRLSAKGTPKLSDRFDEWLMGLPDGWITEVPGVTWNETLKACGNGVVPQQAVAALRFLLRRAA